MPEPTAPASAPQLTDDQQLYAIALSGVLQGLLKKPEVDDDEQPSNSGITNELNKTLALNMAQALAVGFGQ